MPSLLLPQNPLWVGYLGLLQNSDPPITLIISDDFFGRGLLLLFRFQKTFELLVAVFSFIELSLLYVSHMSKYGFCQILGKCAFYPIRGPRVVSAQRDQFTVNYSDFFVKRR